MMSFDIEYFTKASGGRTRAKHNEEQQVRRPQYGNAPQYTEGGHVYESNSKKMESM